MIRPVLAARGHIGGVLAAGAGGAAPWWMAGLSSPWAAYQPIGAASLVASYNDVTGNGRHATLGTAPAWDIASGWKFNGLNQYLVTPFVAANDQSQAVFVRFSTLTNTGNLFGTYTNATTGETIWPSLAAQIFYQNHGQVGVPPALTSGNLGIAGARGYRNGVAEGAAMAAGTGTGRPLYIGARNTGGVPAGYCAVYIQAMIIFDSDIGIDIPALVTAMAAL